MTAALDIRGSVRPADSYRPSAPGADDRMRRLLRERPLSGNGRYGCYHIADSSPYSDIARAVECEVFQEFFGNDPEIMTEAYAAYETHSSFLLAVDREQQQPAGALRIISNSPSGMKTLNDIAEPPLSLPVAQVRLQHGIGDLDACWDVGTLAVLREYRGQAKDHYVSTMLYGLFYAEARRQGVEHVVTVLDKHAYAQLTQVLGVPFVPIAGSEPFNYLGSENSRAAYMNVPGAHALVEAHMNRLDKNVLPLLKPYLMRLMYSEGLPKVVSVR
jgi:hypothetical protein